MIATASPPRSSSKTRSPLLDEIASHPVATEVDRDVRGRHKAIDHARLGVRNYGCKKRMTAPAATPEEELGEVLVTEPYIAKGQTVAFSGKIR